MGLCGCGYVGSSLSLAGINVSHNGITIRQIGINVSQNGITIRQIDINVRQGDISIRHVDNSIKQIGNSVRQGVNCLFLLNINVNIWLFGISIIFDETKFYFMPIPDLNIQCRIGELPVLGGFLINTLQTNLTAISAVYPAFDAAFVTQANTDMAAIEALINPSQLTGELKVITRRLYTNMDVVLRDRLTILEGYLNQATGLTMAVKDFGVSNVRKSIAKNDAEGASSALNTLLQNVAVAANMTALTAKGYTTAQHTANVNLRNDLKNDNLAQNTKLNDRNNLVTVNVAKINLFWTKIKSIADAGKRVMKITTPNKVNDFTMAELKRRIRQERNNTRLNGMVTAGSVKVKDAKIEMKPLLGGRRRTGKSKASGAYEILSMEPGDYLVSVTKSGFLDLSEEVTIVTGETLVKNFNLV